MAFQPPFQPASGRPLPLDDDGWDWAAFERFCLDFVTLLPEVANADLYGVAGDKQDGIDVLAGLHDGRKRTYQCKKVRKFAPADVRKAIAANTFEGASEHVLLVACRTSRAAQDEVLKHHGWQMLDKEGISSRVRTALPREQSRRLVDDHLGAPIRRVFLGGEARTFMPAEEYFRPFERDGLFRHTWTLVGRADIADELEARARTTDVVVVTGRGGIGKTRLLREVAARLHRVLFAADEAPITVQSVEDLPLDAVTVIVDDVHRRDDLGPLLAAAVRRPEKLRLILATRPQATDALLSDLRRAGYDRRQIFEAPPLDDLPLAASEDLARQALGVGNEQHAEALAAATADCPLVTLVGGQLLASDAIAPALLANQADFRRVVLSRWQQEIIGQIGATIDADTAAETLRLLAALAPLSVEDAGTLDAIGVRLHVERSEVLRLLGDLEQAGLVLARGRLRRIVPDVLSDHILHEACVDAQGRSVGYADRLVEDFSRYALPRLLRNLAEMDWRIDMNGGATRVLSSTWAGIQQAFAEASAAARMSWLETIRPAALFAPVESLELAKIAMTLPARTSSAPVFGKPTEDRDVQAALPAFLEPIGQHPAQAAAVMEMLWQLGRDDDRLQHPHPDHPLRILERLGSYAMTPTHWDALVRLVETLMGDASRPASFWPPVALLRPLTGRNVEQQVADGFSMHFLPGWVREDTTAGLRARVWRLLRSAAADSDPRTQYVAADLLGDALQPPQHFGQSASTAVIASWNKEELRLFGVLGDLVRSGPPLVRMELRRRAAWYQNAKPWPEEIGEAARNVVALPRTEQEELYLMLAHRFDLGEDWEDSARIVERFAVQLLDHPDEEILDTLDEAVAELQATRELHPDPGQLMFLMTQRRPAFGFVTLEACLAAPDRPLLPFAAAVINPLRRAAAERVDELLARFDTDDVRLRLLLAESFADAAWLATAGDAHIDRLRRLLHDPDERVRSQAAHCLVPLAKTNPSLAADLALTADAGASSVSHLVDLVLGETAPQLSDQQIIDRLRQLRTAARFDWSTWRFLAEVGQRWPDRVLQTLLAQSQASQADPRPSVEIRRTGMDPLAGFNQDQYAAALRSILNAVRDAKSLDRTRLGHLFWLLDRDADLWMAVLGQGLTDDDLEGVRAATSVLEPLTYMVVRSSEPEGWQLLLERDELVSGWLDAAGSNGPEHESAVSAALLQVLTSGFSGRSGGEPDQRFVKLQHRATELAASRPVLSASARFWDRVAVEARERLADDRLQDEEFGEEDR